MFSRYKPTLISLFAKVQELKTNPQNPQLCLEIQEALINRITYIERKIRVLKKEIGNNKKRMRTVYPVRLTKTEANELKNAGDNYHHLIEQYENLLVIFREIGDAIAFIYIDKWDIKPMAFKQSAGYLSGKKGARLERKMLRGLFGMGIIVILNDLTNCLRYGDITVPKDGKFMLIEAKSGGKHRLDKRGTRQSEFANNVINYLLTDQTHSLYGNTGLFARASLQSGEKHHRDKLNEIIENALNNEVSCAETEEGVFYYASTRFDETSLNNLVGKSEGQPIIVFLNFIDNTAYYPFTLSVCNPNALYEFYKGRLNILVIVTANVIQQKCLARGFEVEFLTDDDWMFKLRHPKYAGYNEDGVKISRHIFGRVFGEFLGLDWFLNEMMNMSDFDPSFLIMTANFNNHPLHLKENTSMN